MKASYVLNDLYNQSDMQSISMQHHGKTIEEGPDFIPHCQVEFPAASGGNDGAQFSRI